MVINFFFFFYARQAFPVSSGEVEKWKRFEISYNNSSWSGNPFDLEFSATFTHKDSGRALKQFGFYGGNNTWKVYFMPDGLGEWTFQTTSADPELDQKVGSFNCIPSNLPGRLTPEGNRWKLEETGAYDAPIMIPTRQWFKRTETSNGISDFILWANDTVGARIIGTTLVYFGHAQDEVPYMKGKEGEEFNIAMWDRLNEHYDLIRDQGMGHYIMFYSDDSESPNKYGITEYSPEELRLFRYAVARLSPYPMVMWDSGIDISETRSDGWIDWFADWFNDNDPWKHPVDSRSGGGSGGRHATRGGYYSDGASTLPDHNAFVNAWNSRTVPTAFTDRWREDYGRGGFNSDKIRRAIWEIGLVGGSALYVSGSDNGGYLTDTYASDFKAAPYGGYAANFFRNKIGDFGKLEPHDELVISGNSVVLSAIPGNEYVAYLPFGGNVIIDLSHATGDLDYEWYNPRQGTYSNQEIIQGGSNKDFIAPSSDDWVLYIKDSQSGSDPDIVPPSAPSNLRL
jgi:hypothetical protein